MKRPSTLGGTPVLPWMGRTRIGADRKRVVRSRGRSSAGRAPALQAGGREFDPPRLHQPQAGNRGNTFFKNSHDESSHVMPSRMACTSMAGSSDGRRHPICVLVSAAALRRQGRYKPALCLRPTWCSRVGLYGQVNKRVRWMPRQLKAMKDVVACDKPRGAGKQALIRGSPNGETQPACGLSSTEYIGRRSEPGELKYLSTRRKRNQPRFP